MSLIRLSQPSAEPFDVPAAKEHLQETLVDTANDDYIGLLITVARQTAEERLERTLLSSRWRLTMDDWGDWQAIIRLQRPPIISVDTVKYVATDGTLTTLANTEYQVDLDAEPGRLAPAFGRFWPIVRYSTLAAVQIEYTAGYPDADSIPKSILHWMKLAIKDMYERRAASAERPAVAQDFACDLLWMGNAVWSA